MKGNGIHALQAEQIADCCWDQRGNAMDLTRKVCMLGDFGVGKTSLVARFIHQSFTERYITTIGVKVDTKLLEVGEHSFKLVLWDIAGRNALDLARMSYLQGASGVLLVADGTREPSMRSAVHLFMQARGELPDLKAVLLVNKFDLLEQWEVGPAALVEARRIMPVFESSARTGEGVEAGFAALAGQLS